MMHLCRFIHGKKCSSLGDVDNGETIYVWDRGIWEIFYLPLNFVVNKTALKNLKKKDVSTTVMACNILVHHLQELKCSIAV